MSANGSNQPYSGYHNRPSPADDAALTQVGSGTPGGDCRLDLSQLGAVADLWVRLVQLPVHFIGRGRARSLLLITLARLRCLLQASSVPVSLTTEL